MFGTHDLALFALTALVINATPGVDLLFTLTRTLQWGLRGGVAAALGIGAGCVLHTLAAAGGLAALLAASPSAFALLKWAGAGYLLWLAVGMVLVAFSAEAPRGAGDTAASASVTSAAAPAELTPPRAPAGPAKLNGLTEQGPWVAVFRQGFFTNALNPKVALFFLALLPQFIEADALHKSLSFLFLGLWFAAQGTLFLLALVLAVMPLRRWQPSRGALRGLNLTGAGLFGWLASRLAT